MSERDMSDKQTIKRLKESLSYWEKCAELEGQSAEYYREELSKAHTLIGRITHQLSERLDSVNLTKYYPTDNHWHLKTVNNPTGEHNGKKI